MKKIIIFIVIPIFNIHLSAIKIDRVILSTDLNKGYYKFWPQAARMWKKILGVKPTLAFIAPENNYIDESLGDVIRFNPIPNIPTSLQAQTIRLLLPILFPNEVCIVSDIDLFPLQKEYFIETVKDIPENYFIIYRKDGYKTTNYYPMCYVAGKGSTFYEIFVEPFNDKIKNISNKKDIIYALIKHWATFNWGWYTDETILAQYVNSWKNFQDRCIRFSGLKFRRISKLNDYLIEDLKNKKYVDAILPKPYLKYKNEITKLFYLGFYL